MAEASPAEKANRGAESRKEPRRMVQVLGNYRSRARGGGARDIWIKDISETGCRFFDKFSVLAVGSDILFRVGNVGPISATVRWREKSAVGIEFDRALHPSVFEHIVATMDCGGAD